MSMTLVDLIASSSKVALETFAHARRVACGTAISIGSTTAHTVALTPSGRVAGKRCCSSHWSCQTPQNEERVGLMGVGCSLCHMYCTVPPRHLVPVLPTGLLQKRSIPFAANNPCPRLIPTSQHPAATAVLFTPPLLYCSLLHCCTVHSSTAVLFTPPLLDCSLLPYPKLCTRSPLCVLAFTSPRELQTNRFSAPPTVKRRRQGSPEAGGRRRCCC